MLLNMELRYPFHFFILVLTRDCLLLLRCPWLCSYKSGGNEPGNHYDSGAPKHQNCQIQTLLHAVGSEDSTRIFMLAR